VSKLLKGNMKYIETKIGRCLTETKRSDYDSLVSSYSTFLHVSQWDDRFNPFSTEIFIPLDDLKINNSGKLSNATLTFGVNNQSLLFIGQIIDSSD